MQTQDKECKFELHKVLHILAGRRNFIGLHLLGNNNRIPKKYKEYAVIALHQYPSDFDIGNTKSTCCLFIGLLYLKCN